MLPDWLVSETHQNYVFFDSFADVSYINTFENSARFDDDVIDETYNSDESANRDSFFEPDVNNDSTWDDETEGDDGHRSSLA